MMNTCLFVDTEAYVWDNGQFRPLYGTIRTIEIFLPASPWFCFQSWKIWGLGRREGQKWEGFALPILCPVFKLNCIYFIPRIGLDTFLSTAQKEKGRGFLLRGGGKSCCYNISSSLFSTWCNVTSRILEKLFGFTTRLHCPKRNFHGPEEEQQSWMNNWKCTGDKKKRKKKHVIVLCRIGLIMCIINILFNILFYLWGFLDRRGALSLFFKSTE